MSGSTKVARALIADLNRRKPHIYWIDFLITSAVALPAAFVFMREYGTLPVWIGCYVIAVAGLYRLSLFMHEISHFRRGEMRAFTIVWNLFAGIPMLVPSFFYETHIDHHNTRHYGTHRDGEYLPLASQSWRSLAAYFAQIFYLPIMTLIRFGIIAPISMLHPKLRRWTLEHWSSFVINLRYQREISDSDPVRLWALVEMACFLRLAFLIPAILLGRAPWYVLFLMYSLAIGILTLNHIRTLAAHRYAGLGEAMSHEDQMLDSTNVTSASPWTLVLCPLGLRFHALHHLFPGMPYHNLAKAHRRLTEQLPADAPYHKCTYPTIFSVIRELLIHLQPSQRYQQQDRSTMPPSSTMRMASGG